MRPGGVVLLVAAMATACGSPPATGSTSTASPDGSAILDPAAVGVTCGDSPAFHPALLEQTGTAQLDEDPAAQALRAFLDTPSGAAFGAESWVRVLQTPERVDFLGRRGGDELSFVSFTHRAGTWMFASAGGCSPEVALPPGVSRAEWRLDPAFPAPRLADRTIHVLINELACASGQSPEGRVLPPLVAPAADRVTIAILVRSVAGGADCPGNPDFPLAVALPEPVGERKLFDGAVFPPAGPIGAFAISCGTVDETTCQERAAQIVAEATRDQPARTVVSIEILDELGSYSVLFDDGTGATLIVN